VSAAALLAEVTAGPSTAAVPRPGSARTAAPSTSRRVSCCRVIPDSFVAVRPLPARATLGGVATRTRWAPAPPPRPAREHERDQLGHSREPDQALPGAHAPVRPIEMLLLVVTCQPAFEFPWGHDERGRGEIWSGL
jgi:hypothetical protein